MPVLWVKDILEISAQVWEGHDYIPQVLDRWLAAGSLFAAELKGKVVGFAHGYMEFHAMVPRPRLVQALSQQGLSCKPDFRYVLVYEYPLP